MCGIWAIVPANQDPAGIEKLRIVGSMLHYMNCPRGRQSWGLWEPGKEAVKSLGPSDLVPEPARNFFAQWEGADWMAGHTRQSTSGSITVENQHPFHVVGGPAFPDLRLAHNGVVQVEGYGWKDHAVDSGRIALSIADNGMVEGMSRVSGMCSLLVEIEGKLWIYRHSQVLSLATCEYGYIVSSDDDHIKAALRIVGINHQMWTIPEDTFMSPWSDPALAVSAPAKKYQSSTTKGGARTGHWDKDKMKFIWDDDPGYAYEGYGGEYGGYGGYSGHREYRDTRNNVTQLNTRGGSTKRERKKSRRNYGSNTITYDGDSRLKTAPKDIPCFYCQDQCKKPGSIWAEDEDRDTKTGGIISIHVAMCKDCVDYWSEYEANRQAADEKDKAELADTTTASPTEDPVIATLPGITEPAGQPAETAVKEN